jgi:aldose 1-epimerase
VRRRIARGRSPQRAQYATLVANELPAERATSYARAREGEIIFTPGVTRRSFGTLADGSPIDLYVITKGDVELSAMTYGGIIVSLRVPDRDGRAGDVVLGHETLERYLPNPAYLGAVAGRCANRIANGRFRLDGISYQLAANDGAHHLHGGNRGFDRHVWTALPIREGDDVGVRFSRTSPAGEEHYPGTLQVSVTYLVSISNVIEIRYEAATDAPTIVNLTQHSYFNLAGESSTSVLDHHLTIHADGYTPVDSSLIPTGEIAPVDGTPSDFRNAAAIGERLQRHRHTDEQLRRGRGYDHNFVLAGGGGTLAPAAELFDRTSGRSLTVATTEPGLQFYSGQLLDGRARGAYGRVLGPHAGLCLETQHFPDTPNHPAFPAITLRAGQTYRSTTTWQFATRKS